jgi:choline dehydrogenase-like flavoprotein
MGHGCKIENTCMLPSYFLAFLPWQQLPPPKRTSPALTFKTRCASFAHTIGFVIITRDRDTGLVYPDPTDGRVRIKYTTSRFDANNLVDGVIAAAKIAWVCGAREVYSMHPDLAPFVRPKQLTTAENDDSEQDGAEAIDKEFDAWLARLRHLGIDTPDPCTIASAHQMGTCRMSATPRNGVVDPRGRVWGTDEGLWVADASVFPSASGVNPMVSTMAIAEWVSRGVSAELRRAREGK